MGKKTTIEWTHYTGNLWWGCTKVHEGCDHCYAEILAHRWKFEVWGNNSPRRKIESVWNDLRIFQTLAAKSKERHRVFVGSMMDIFEKPMPMVDSKGNKCFVNVDNTMPLDTGLLRDELFMEISENKYPNLIFLFLTKRPSNINKMIPEEWKENPPENVMFGTSVVNQATADTLIPQLLKVKGKRFLSIEPQLDIISLTHMDVEKAGDSDWCWINALTGRQTDMCRPCADVPKIDWVINGGESGPGKRPFNLEWARKLRDECKEAGVPYFFKQIDKVQDKKTGIPEDLKIREFPKYHLA